MNKKEISEIKKLLTKDNCRISHLCGCYVDGEKKKVLCTRDAFRSLPEEEASKYFDIFRRVLSGTVGKNVLNMEFPLVEELEDGKQAFLLRLVHSELQEDELLQEYYDRVIETFTYTENYLILLADLAYDIPKRGSDGEEQFDASDYVYHAVLSAICPVALSKPGLSYNAEDNRIENRLRDRVVGVPEIGFLFPAFTDRNTDLHSLLFYSKNAALPNASTAEDLLGCVSPVPAAAQQDSFNQIVETVLGEECCFDAVRSIHENLTELIEENKQVPDPVTLDSGDVKRLLQVCGAKEESLPAVDEELKATLGEHASVPAGNIARTRSFEVKTPDIRIQVKPDRTDLIETRVIDGREYLLIELCDDVTVNGIHIRSGAGTESAEKSDKA